ncbi:DUF1156 domain-containing protein [uncultured Cloacibacillus sp.]|uniref:DUF1156 domain-containing protein n=1 Tax=uncultured Cloacibacillus sp. TaxID=889794 RepID=UPI0026089B2E|nr:DUF1156 domain-containing protein [uncultured Cloacibacillus sp.]
MPKKLIEVSLPLDAINAESAREKSIRHGHPSTLHLWWARRPLAAARAVIWSSLVDDPSSHPELFPTEKEQSKERERLFGILTKLVKWENSNNPEILAEAKAEIKRSMGDDIPALLDPFAGGGAIPLEAQRLGLEAHAHDLNPVAVMINKAMIEIPPKFAGKPPVNPESPTLMGRGTEWNGAKGLAEDVRYYGEWMKREAFQRIGHLYPKVKVPKEQGGGEATVIAWIWARTIKCPNPACGCEMPLANSFVLFKKNSSIVWAEPIFDKGTVSFTVHHDGMPKLEGTVNRRGAVCACCGTPVGFHYIREEGQAGRLGARLCAVIAEGNGGRLYISADTEQVQATQTERSTDIPNAALPSNPRDFKTPNYGMRSFADLFTNRQLTALTTFSDLVGEALKKAESDAAAAGLPDDHAALRDGGTGARAYGESIAVYLSFAIDKLADYHSAICSWHNSKELIRNTFGRQAIPMIWDYAEANPFCHSSGCFDNMLEWVTKCVGELPSVTCGVTRQFDAQSDCGMRNIMISTDPPYYDNIGYADLSDFFYVWMRRSLRNIYPNIFRTMLVPKAEELVATPYRFDGSEERAREFFEDGMLQSCRQIYDYARADIPVTIYYAYKQSDTETGENGARTQSTGWETMLSAVIRAGFTITGTWPMRTELSVRSLAQGTNALASSIVLVCRKRDESAPVCTRHDFIKALRRELKPALQKLQQSNIAPVDLAQSAIGPGIAVFSRYKNVLEADGSAMSVRSALQIINQELDRYFSGQDSNIDSDSRFCIELFSLKAYNTMGYGDADVLARAKGASISRLVEHNVVYAAKGDVRLLTREELPEKVELEKCGVWMLTQLLVRAMGTGGIEGCALTAAAAHGSLAEEARNLAYRLYSICERKNWAEEGRAYNSLVSEWPKIKERAADLQASRPVQGNLFD